MREMVFRQTDTAPATTSDVSPATATSTPAETEEDDPCGGDSGSGSSGGALGGGNSTAITNNLDELIERIEERVLAELERRGGRFGEVL